MKHKRIIGDFIRQYRDLCILSALSVLVAIAYVFTSDLPEWFPFAEELFALINALGLAIVANCIFCFFQVYLLEQRERECVEPVMSLSIEKILRLISDPYERIYHQKTGKNLDFDKIPKEEMKTLLEGVDPKAESGYKAVSPDSKLVSPPTYWVVYQHIEKTRGEIEQFIGLFGRYLGGEEISLLMNIHKCSYFTLITQLHNSGVLDKLTNLGPLEDLVPLQELYVQLKNYGRK